MAKTGKMPLTLWIDAPLLTVQYRPPLLTHAPHDVQSSLKTSSACSRASPACSAGAASTLTRSTSARRSIPTASRMTIVVRGDDATLEQVIKQLNKLVDVIEVQDFRDGEYVDRELVLVRVTVDFEDAARR